MKTTGFARPLLPPAYGPHLFAPARAVRTAAFLAVFSLLAGPPVSSRLYVNQGDPNAGYEVGLNIDLGPAQSHQLFEDETGFVAAAQAGQGIALLRQEQRPDADGELLVENGEGGLGS